MYIKKSKLKRIIAEEMRRFLTEKKKKKKKKKKKEVKCPGQVGNPYHSSKTGKNPGGFTNPDEEAGSWSHRNAPSGAKCRGQASRNAANRKQTFTKIICGRGSKYKCHKGEEKKYEEGRERADGIIDPNEQTTKELEDLFKSLGYSPEEDELEEEHLLGKPGTASRRDKVFPGSQDARKLANGIFEALQPIFEEMDRPASNGGRKRCFSEDELKAYRASIVRGIWLGISAYTKASKGEFEI